MTGIPKKEILTEQGIPVRCGTPECGRSICVPYGFIRGLIETGDGVVVSAFHHPSKECDESNCGQEPGTAIVTNPEWAAKVVAYAPQSALRSVLELDS